MPMTLDQLLQLLPDNSAGEIGADDLRTIVTELFNAAHTVGDVTTFDWSATDATPGAGKVFLDQGWSLASTSMALSETTTEGGLLSFAAIDGPNPVRFVFKVPAPVVTGQSVAGDELRGHFTGPSADQGNFRTVPIVVDSLVGVAPSNGQPLQTFFVVGP